MHFYSNNIDEEYLQECLYLHEDIRFELIQE
jgi:hypothetical protein